MWIKFPILAFNDVYRISQKYVSQPGAPNDPSSSKEGRINVSQFGELINTLRAGWPDRPAQKDGSQINGQDKDKDEDEIDGAKEEKGDKEKEKEEKEGLVVFAGDVFNPSVESSVTRGSHMVSRSCTGVAEMSYTTSGQSLKKYFVQVPIMNALKVDCAVVGQSEAIWSISADSLIRQPRFRFRLVLSSQGRQT